MDFFPFAMIPKCLSYWLGLLMLLLLIRSLSVGEGGQKNDLADYSVRQNALILLGKSFYAFNKF